MECLQGCGMLIYKMPGTSDFNNIVFTNTFKDIFKTLSKFYDEPFFRN